MCIRDRYYSVNYDTRTVAAMVAAFGTEAVAEGYYREQVDDVLKHYTAAEVATAGIFPSTSLANPRAAKNTFPCSKISRISALSDTT